MTATSIYQTAIDFRAVKAPSHIGNKQPQETLDNARVQAYWTYEDIFHNQQGAFTAVLRDDAGNEISRRYVPSARTIVEAANRYLAQGTTWVAAEKKLDGTPAVQADIDAAVGALNALFTREEFVAKFLSMKRWMLIRGDAILHLSVDMSKPLGSRLRITDLDPSTYFTVQDPVDAERTSSVYLVSIVQDDDGDDIVQRLVYTKTPTGTISVKLGYFEVDGWDDREGQATKSVETPSAVSAVPSSESALEGFELPPLITAIPVYHFKNSRRGSGIFGVSELQGIETLISGINQTAQDQDVSIGLFGIGAFWTDSGHPKDAKGNDVDWEIAPGSVWEIEQGAKVGRLEGATSIEPMLAHSGYLEQKARETTATPDVAVGQVDVKVASSGVALAFQMHPMVAKNAEKEVGLKSKLDQLLYDLLNGWLPAFEEFTPSGVIVNAMFREPLPADRAAVLKEILGMVEAKVISIAFAQSMIRERLGYQIPPDMLSQIVAEQSQLLDAAGARIADAAGDGFPDTTA